MRRLIKVFLSHLLFYSGSLRLSRRIRRDKGQFCILMYHHIAVRKEDEGLPVAVFRKQMTWIKRNYSVVGLSQLLQQGQGKPFPKGTLAITFDDGHQDFLTGAYPTLRKQELPVTLFAVVDCLDQKPLRRTTAEGQLATSPMLTWEELIQLSQDGVEIGAHTLSHSILSRLSLSQAKHEIAESKWRLEDRLRKPVSVFCYPNGKTEDFNVEIERVVEAAGFLGACTAIEGKNRATDARYALRRLSTSERSLPVFACELEGCFNLFKGGLSSFLKELRERLWCSRILLLFERPFKTSPSVLRLIGSFEFGWFDERESAQLTRLQGDLTLQRIRERLARGDRCFVARRDGIIAAFVWVATQPVEIWDLRNRVPLRQGQVYRYNAKVDPRYRGRGLFPWLVHHLEEILSREGKEGFLIAVQPDNDISIRTNKRDGFVQIGYLRYQRRFFWMRKETVLFDPTTPFSYFRVGGLKKCSAMTPAVVVGQGWTGLSVDRLLAGRGIPLIKVAESPLALGARSRYGQLETLPNGDTGGFLSLLKQIHRHYHTQPVLIPTTDAAVRWLSKDRDRLQKEARFLLPEKGLVELLLDKGCFAEEMSRQGIPAPTTKTVRNQEELERVLSDPPFPCVVKPCNRDLVSFGEAKALLVSEEGELRHVSDRLLRQKSSLIVQELVPGDDSRHWSCAAYLNEKGEPLALFTAQKIRQYPPFLGIGSVCESRWNDRVATQAVSLLRQMRYVGVAEVEFKEDPRDGTLKVLEANPRLWIQHSLAARCGIDFAFLVYRTSLGSSPEPLGRQREGIRWSALDLDMLTVRQLFREGKMDVAQWLGAYRLPMELAPFRWNDPSPAFCRMRDILCERLR